VFIFDLHDPYKSLEEEALEILGSITVHSPKEGVTLALLTEDPP
jgi:hypothetical protein